MRHPIPFLLLVGWSILPLPVKAVDLRAEMPAETFTEAGLEQLTPEQLAALERWIDHRHPAMEPSGDETTQAGPMVAMPVGDDRFGLEMVKDRVTSILGESPDRIVSTIDGTFRGWSRKGEVFTLANGQQWRTAENKRFVVNLDHPEVTVVRGAFETYYLMVTGYGSRIRVERLR